MSTKEIEVQVMGKIYNFSIPEDFDSKHFMEIIDYVESKFKRVKSEADDLDVFKLGLLTSINIAEEYYSMKVEYDKLRGALERIDRMVSPAPETGKPELEPIAINFSP